MSGAVFVSPLATACFSGRIEASLIHTIWHQAGLGGILRAADGGVSRVCQHKGLAHVLRSRVSPRPFASLTERTSSWPAAIGLAWMS